MQLFSAYPGFVPIWLAVAGLWLFRFAAALGAGAMVGMIAEKVGRYLPAVLLSGLLLALLLLLF